MDQRREAGAHFGENVFAVHNTLLCQYGFDVKLRINFNTTVHNIVEIYASTCLTALLRKIYTDCTHVSALDEIYFPDERIDFKATAR